MPIVLIGIDDTDNDTSPGTGQLARRLSREIAQRGAKPLGITRHQFLLDDRIAYSTHNSGACVAIDWAGALRDLDFAADLITEWSADGSDPGICITTRNEVVPDIVRWGWSATRQVLTQGDAVSLAQAHGISLRALGGTGDGIIGALASVGLRADGNEGRFLDLPGLRDLGDLISIRELTDLGIAVDHASMGAANTAAAAAGDGMIYKTMNWVRPSLVQGQPVWHVEWSDNEHAWIAVDRKKSRPLE